MKIETRGFGTIEIDDERVIKFVGPMLGFEGADRYVLVDLNPENPFKILHLATDPDVCFLVTDPALFFPDYNVELSREQVADIELDDPSKAAVMVVVTLRDNGAKLTANLLGPVVVNTENFLGKQLILSGTNYKVDEPLHLQADPKQE
jgi:flagellar assembly factor FliW